MELEYNTLPTLHSTGSDSPVNADWSTCAGSPDKNRTSAGTISPRRNRIRSPGTISRAGICVQVFSRFTRAWSANFALRAAIAFPA